MGSWLHHWVWDDLWGPVWPNLVASLVVYMFVYFKMRSLKKLNEQLMHLHVKHHHEQMAAHADLVKAVSQPGDSPGGGVRSADGGES